MDLNYYPKHFKKINNVIIKKPSKKGILYKNLKIYKPIILLSMLGKALEIFFIRTITRIAKKRYLLSN